jgi:hypothetical protein
MREKVPVKFYRNSLTILQDLINGVELNFDLNTSQDFTTGQEENKTDQCGVSKKDYN